MSTETVVAPVEEPSVEPEANAPLAEKLSAATESPKPEGPDSPAAATEPEETTHVFSVDGLRAAVKEKFGHDLSRYDNDDAALAALLSAKDLASRRDTEADFGREIRDTLEGKSEAEVRALLAGEAPAAESTSDDSFDPAVARTQIRRTEAGDLEPLPGAPAGIVQQYLKHEEKRTVAVDRLVTDPVEFLSEVFGDTIKQQVLEQTGQQTALQREENAINRWSEEHGELLSDPKNPDVLTPLGRAVQEAYESPRLQKIDAGKPRSLDRLETALELGKAAMPQGKTSKPSRQSTRRPDTVAALPDDSPRKEGESLAAYLFRTLEKGSAVG